MLDADGQKMSKSKGNGIDPLDVIDSYGADALRFAMTHASTGGQDIRWDERRVEMGRNFNNKLWNAARFAMMQLGRGVPRTPARPSVWPTAGWPAACSAPSRAPPRRSRRTTSGRPTGCSTTWSGRSSATGTWRRRNRRCVPATAARATCCGPRFEALLKLLHPILPFITSEIFEALGHERQIAVTAWPEVDTALLDDAAERDFDVVRQAVGAVRALRADADLAPSQTIPVHVAGEASAALLAEREVAASLARAELKGEAPRGAALTQVVPGLELKLPFEGLVDEAEWRDKQRRRLEKLRAERERSERKLANAKFTANAPEAVVAEERRRLSEAEDLIDRIEAAVSRLGDGG